MEKSPQNHNTCMHRHTHKSPPPSQLFCVHFFFVVFDEDTKGMHELNRVYIFFLILVLLLVLLCFSLLLAPQWLWRQLSIFVSLSIGKSLEIKFYGKFAELKTRYFSNEKSLYLNWCVKAYSKTDSGVKPQPVTHYHNQ